MFDDTKENMKICLKRTEGKRYGKQFEDINLTPTFVMNDWEKIIKSPSNKANLKRIIIMGEFIQNGVAEEMDAMEMERFTL